MNNKMHPTDQILQPDHSQSYILRLWQADRNQPADWRASLEILESGQRMGFSSLEQLFAYLMDKCERIGEHEQPTNQE
jgi:hypothetical protein